LIEGKTAVDSPFVTGNILLEFIVSLLDQTVIPLNFSMNTTISFLLVSDLSG
jgi:hypothetical protein